MTYIYCGEHIKMIFSKVAHLNSPYADWNLDMFKRHVMFLFLINYANIACRRFKLAISFRGVRICDTFEIAAIHQKYFKIVRLVMFCYMLLVHRPMTDIT